MLRTWERGGGGVVSSKFDRGLGGGGGGVLKMLSKNTCEGVRLIVVKLPAISLEACKFT